MVSNCLRKLVMNIMDSFFSSFKNTEPNNRCLRTSVYEYPRIKGLHYFFIRRAKWLKANFFLSKGKVLSHSSTDGPGSQTFSHGREEWVIIAHYIYYLWFRSTILYSQWQNSLMVFTIYLSVLAPPSPTFSYHSTYSST